MSEGSPGMTIVLNDDKSTEEVMCITFIDQLFNMLYLEITIITYKQLNHIKFHQKP